MVGSGPQLSVGDRLPVGAGDDIDGAGCGGFGSGVLESHPLAQFGEVGVLGGSRPGIVDGHLAELDRCGAHQQVGGLQGVVEPVPLARGQGRQEFTRLLVRAGLHLLPDLAPGVGEAGDAASAVGGIGGGGAEPLALEPAQGPGQLPRVQAEHLSQGGHGDGVDGPDLVEQPGDRERPSHTEEGVLQDAHTLGVDAVEVPEHRQIVHLSDNSQINGRRQCSGWS
jgi:hypothetical protein